MTNQDSDLSEINTEFDRSMNTPSPNTPSPPKGRLDAMLDEPSRNPRYGGMTMREMVRKVVLRRGDQVEKRKKRNVHP